jgi:hypothetical protein
MTVSALVANADDPGTNLRSGCALLHDPIHELLCVKHDG